ncbi:uncharacterized protein LOC105698478 [Orussus abietinus]|uniref:uncharacterized protein LOC105698478 n=1 Tax=Orussus abietinus TaxID=222816 RepID=UPI0006268109|nr:uncharacterized protein LOC105698478 [Orussus abietinus]
MDLFESLQEEDSYRPLFKAQNCVSGIRPKNLKRVRALRRNEQHSSSRFREQTTPNKFLEHEGAQPGPPRLFNYFSRTLIISVYILNAVNKERMNFLDADNKTKSYSPVLHPKPARGAVK